MRIGAFLLGGMVGMAAACMMSKQGRSMFYSVVSSISGSLSEVMGKNQKIVNAVKQAAMPNAVGNAIGNAVNMAGAGKTSEASDRSTYTM